MSAYAYYMATSEPYIPTATTNGDNGNSSTHINNPAAFHNSTASNNPPDINNPTVANYPIDNFTPTQSKRYFCAHRKHGHNNTHDTKDCRKLKQEEQKSRGLRNILFTVAKQTVDKADKTRKAKQKEEPFANYNNLELKLEAEELKKKLEDIKQEMRKRGIR